jgi:pimeloyl-ACP methyl ester carboxylesterase
MTSAVDDLPELPGVTHRWVKLASMRMHVAEAGEGPPLLMLHGWPQHWWSFRLLIPELSRRFRVIAPDLRGLGWSEAPAGDYSKAALAADVLELLDAEGIERARVIGHDWGGFIAFLLALEHPDRLERLLALDIPPPWVRRPRPRQLALPLLASYQVLLATPRLGQGLLRRGPGTVRTIIRLASGPRMRWSAQELDCYADRLREPARARASSAYYRTFLTRELPAMVARGDRSGELSVPSLLLMGERSAIDRVLTPQPGGLLEVQRVRRAGHFLPEEAPREVLDAASAWFDG